MYKWKSWPEWGARRKGTVYHKHIFLLAHSIECTVAVPRVRWGYFLDCTGSVSRWLAMRCSGRRGAVEGVVMPIHSQLSSLFFYNVLIPLFGVGTPILTSLKSHQQLFSCSYCSSFHSFVCFSTNWHVITQTKKFNPIMVLMPARQNTS